MTYYHVIASNGVHYLVTANDGDLTSGTATFHNKYPGTHNDFIAGFCNPVLAHPVDKRQANSHPEWVKLS